VESAHELNTFYFAGRYKGKQKKFAARRKVTKNDQGEGRLKSKRKKPGGQGYESWTTFSRPVNTGSSPVILPYFEAGKKEIGQEERNQKSPRTKKWGCEIKEKTQERKTISYFPKSMLFHKTQEGREKG